MGSYFAEANVGVLTLSKVCGYLNSRTAMRHSQHDDPNLAEVKAVLDRLHRISRGLHADDMQTAKKQAPPRQLPQAAERLVPEEDPALSPAIETATPSDHPNVTKRRLLQAVAAIAALLVVFGGIARFTALNRQTASVAPTGDVVRRDSVAAATGGATIPPVYPPAAAPTPLVPETQRSPAALQAASVLMTSGQVQAARTELLRVAQEGSADVAWALARSYDPNFLGAIAATDASPDVVQATRWYRTWHDIAVKQGLVADSVSVERIIRSMR
jgi:hypothetical protein